MNNISLSEDDKSHTNQRKYFQVPIFSDWLGLIFGGAKLASPPNPLSRRGGEISNLYLLRF